MSAPLRLELAERDARLLLAMLVPRLWILPSNEQVEVCACAGTQAAWEVTAAGPAWALGRQRSTQERAPLEPAPAAVWLRVAQLAALEALEVWGAPGATILFRRRPGCARWSFHVTLERECACEAAA